MDTFGEKTVYFDNLRFTKDDKNGYYRNSVTGARLHRYIWEYYNGPIPNGYEVHHKNFNKNDNTLDNLQCISRKEHRRIHAELLTDEEREWRRNNMNTVVRKAAIEWHKTHSHKGLNNGPRGPKTKKICVFCGLGYETRNKNSLYCSKACKRQSNRDTNNHKVEKVCIVCGNKYISSKYKVSHTCSRRCAGTYGAHKGLYESKISKEN